MDRIKGLLKALRTLLRKRVVEQELDEELQFHLELEIVANVQKGMDREQARRTALIAFGGLERFKEQRRQASWVRIVEDVYSDVRYGIRSLLRSPGLALVIVLTLALGIGANTAIFSALDAVLIRPLPFAEPDRLVGLGLGTPYYAEGQTRPKTSPDMVDAQSLKDVFLQVAAYAPGDLNLSGSGSPRRIRVGVVTTDFFALLGVSPQRGRAFLTEEGRPGAARVALVSDGFWRSHLASTAQFQQTFITLNGARYAVVGVMPRGFAFPDHAEVWIPLSIPVTSASFEPFRQYIPEIVIARLAHGVTIEQARVAVQALYAAYPKRKRSETATELVYPFRSTLAGDQRNVLLILLAATGLVLLLACTNVANLLLSRGLVRQREFAVRVSLGATSARVLRQLLVENMLLAMVGSVVGILIARTGLHTLDALIPANLEGAATIRIDARVLVFTLVTALGTGLAFGLFPALSGRRTDAGIVLKGEGKGSIGGGLSARLRQTLITGEIALAALLLVGSALMLRSLYELLTTESGIEPERVATLELTLDRGDYPNQAVRRQFYEQVLERLANTPHVLTAAAINELPMRGVAGVFFTVMPPGHQLADHDHDHMAQDLDVTSDYFAAMGVRILLGRAPRPQPDTLRMREVVINQVLAERYWPNLNPIGQRLEAAFDTVEVVGVVANVRPRSLESEYQGQTYYSLLDWPFRNAAIIARGRISARELTGILVAAVRDVAPYQAVYNVRTMEQVIAGAIAPRRTNTILITIFGALALALASVGLYGVIAFSVERRTREIGVRIALGARPSRIRLAVLRDALLPALLGTALGVGAAWLLSRLLNSLVYGITTHDAVAFISAPAVLLLTAIIAALIPARRATRVDPLVAIRAE